MVFRNLNGLVSHLFLCSIIFKISQTDIVGQRSTLSFLFSQAIYLETLQQSYFIMFLFFLTDNYFILLVEFQNISQSTECLWYNFFPTNDIFGYFELENKQILVCSKTLCYLRVHITNILRAQIFAAGSVIKTILS